MGAKMSSTDLRMCVCVCRIMCTTPIHTYVCVHTHPYISLHTCKHIHPYMHTHTSIHPSIHTSIHTYIHIHTTRQNNLTPAHTGRLSRHLSAHIIAFLPIHEFIRLAPLLPTLLPNGHTVSLPHQLTCSPHLSCPRSPHSPPQYPHPHLLPQISVWPRRQNLRSALPVALTRWA